MNRTRRQARCRGTRPARHRSTWLRAVLLALLAFPVTAQTLFEELGRRHLPIAEGASYAVAVGDVDADGDVDIVYGNDGPNHLYLGDGTGRFADGTEGRMPADPDRTYALQLVDLDGDGDLDLVAGNDGFDRLYRNDGTGNFADATASLPALDETTWALETGDVDGDGDLDLVVGISSRQNRLYINDGTGTFTDATTGRLPADNHATTVLTLVDVDGDGDLDLMHGASHRPLRLYLNDGTGAFTDTTASHLPSLPLEGTQDLAFGDVDGDGDLDVAVGNTSNSKLLLGDGTGRFVDATSARLHGTTNGVRAVEFGDIDLDGDLDLIAGAGGPDRIYLNDGTGTFAYAPSSWMLVESTSTADLELVDVDADGDLDLVKANGRDRNRLALNDGTGRFAEATRPKIPHDLTYPKAFAWGDVDNDGDPDLVVATWRRNRLLLNHGTGWFTDVTWGRMPATEDRTTGIALLDVDADGDLDILEACDGDESGVYLNDGTGRFPGNKISMGYSLFNDLDLGDLDGDGDVDGVTATASGAVRLINVGSGSFHARGIPAGRIQTNAVALGDVDGDGDLDIVAGNRGQRDRLYLNDGQAEFTDVSTVNLPIDMDYTTSVAFVDVDRDGDLDLVRGVDDGRAGLYENDGTGRFVDVTATRMPAESASTAWVSAGDVDGDGDPDLILSGVRGGRFYENDGAGAFVDRTAANLPILISRVSALLDVDGDGDLDLVQENLGVGRLLTNLRSQLDAPFLMQPGHPFTLDSYARSRIAGAAAVALPYVAAGRARTPLGPLGILRLDPASMVPLPLTPIPSTSGKGSTTFAVPNDQALVGRYFHAQALIIQHPGPSRLTNATQDEVIR